MPTASIPMCATARRPVQGTPVFRERPLTVRMGTSVPMTGVTGAASTLITLIPVMMKVNARKVIPVSMESVEVHRSSVVTGMVVLPTTCNPLTGCVYTTVPGCECDEDADCIDTDVCNGQESCVGNSCVGGTWLDCEDGNECTDNWCDGGCQQANNTGACDDGSQCTESDTCANGACTGSPIVCNDGDGCTTDTCNPLTGCEYPSIPGCECDEDSDCDDDDVCTGQETCNVQTGKCVAGTTPDCDDDDVCTDDSCDPVDGCQYAINTSPCDDGNACTADDICSVGYCQGTPISCDDGNECTDDDCNPASGCSYTSNTSSCDDDIFCNGDDTCSGGTCSDHEGDPCPPDHTCNEGTDTCDPPLPCVLTLIPPSALLNPGDTVQFTPIETGPCNPPVYQWTDTLACGDVDANGLFTAFAEGGSMASSSFLVDELPETGEVCVTDNANGGISACSMVTVVEAGSGDECELLIYEGDCLEGDICLFNVMKY